MLNQKKLDTKLLNNLPRVQEEKQTLSFSSGQGYVDMNYTLPAGATLLLGVLNGRPNADWISADISAISTTACRISYNNTYGSTLSGTVTLKLLYTL